MSRVNRGDGNTKPMNEFEDAFDMATNSRDSIVNADNEMMTVVDSGKRNVGRGQSNLRSLSHGDL